MKKIVIAICTVFALTAIILGICLSSSKPNKYPTSEILVTFSDKEFCSNYRQIPEKALITYTLEFSILNGTTFKNPSLTSSTNITKTYDIKDTKITVTFQILFGDEFSFTLTSENFETLTISKQATEFVQPDSINIEISTSPNAEAQGYVDNSTNIIYIIDDHHKTQALEDSKPSTLFVKAYAPAACGDVVLQASVSENGHFEITVQEYFIEITPKSIGASYITFSATDGSGASKKFLFRVQYVKAESVQGLPDKIDIDLSTSDTFELSNISPVPIYAKGYEVAFESSNEEVFVVTNNKVKALKSGQGNLIVKLDGEVLKTIPVNITGNFTPKFTFSLNHFTTEELGSSINFNENANTITLNCTNLEYDYSTIIINVGFMYYSGTFTAAEASITDPQGAILRDATSPGFGIASQNYVPYTINVLNKNAEIEIEFSKRIYGNLIKSKIKIILSFN